MTIQYADPSQIEQLKRMLEHLEETLRSQHVLLQQRGMALPASALQDVDAARENLEALGAHISEQQTELQRLRALADTARLVNSAMEPAEVLNSVMDTVIHLTGAERGYIVLREEGSEELAIRVARNLDQETIARGAFTVSRSIVNEVAKAGTPIVTTNALSDPRFADQESIVSYALRSILCVPLKVKERVTGVVYADNRVKSGLFGEQELSLLSAFADQAAVAIEHARLFERVRATLTEVTANKDLLENVFASIASGVITTDLQNTIIICNPAASRILNVPRAAILNAPLETSLAELGESFLAGVRQVLEDGIRQTMELQPVIAERGRVILTVRLSPLITQEGVISGVTILIDDLTDIRRREETLAEVRRYLPPAMVENIRVIDTIELGGEEREITVLMADVRGFTSFSEHLEPEELMTVINRYLGVASEAIHLYEGIVDKYMGDAVVGLYNTQINPQDSDHALRAIRAALSMVYDVQALHQLLPPDYRLWYGIGIDTGQAVLGNVGSMERKEFTALGKPMDYAKRLQEAAEHGEILISAATYERVKNRILAEPVERAFRGEQSNHPLPLYRVTGFKRKSAR